MTRGTLMVAAGLVPDAVGMTAARHDEKHEAVRPLALREVAEKLDGKETKATAVEVAFEPGQAGAIARSRVDTNGTSATLTPRVAPDPAIRGPIEYLVTAPRQCWTPFPRLMQNTPHADRFGHAGRDPSASGV